jgi:hypothetical protein
VFNPNDAAMSEMIVRPNSPILGTATKLSPLNTREPQELLDYLELQNRMQHDTVLPARDLAFGHSMGVSGIQTTPEYGNRTYELTKHAENQVRQWAGINSSYWKKMLSENRPKLAALNVNAWLADSDQNRMLRSVGDEIRAFVSDMFLRYDDTHFVQALRPFLDNSDFDLQVRAGGDVLQFDIAYREELDLGRARQVNDPVQIGFRLRHSMWGFARIDAYPFVKRLVCLNGMVVARALPDYRISRVHRGPRILPGIYSERVQMAEVEAINTRIIETANAMALPESRQAIFDEVLKSTEEKPPIDDSMKFYDELANRFNLSEGEKDIARENWVRSGDRSVWGIANGVTFAAHKASADRRHELEQIGGKILELQPRDWKVINEKAMAA